MRKIIPAITLGLALSFAAAAPASAYTAEELRAFATDAEKIAREVQAKCSTDQEKALGESLKACMDVDVACKGYVSETCSTTEGDENDGRMPCDIECVTVRAIACIDAVNEKLPACGITERLKTPEELLAPPADPGEPIFAPGTAATPPPAAPAPVTPTASVPPPSFPVLGWAAVGGTAGLAAVALALVLRKRRP